MADTPSRKQRARSAEIDRIAGLILINALLFHEALAKKDRRVHPLKQIRSSSDLVSELAKAWRDILKINYYPIFHIAAQLLEHIAADAAVTSAMADMIDIALRITDWRAALRHDLAGRIYHRVLAEAKHLGAYYTSIPAAVFLLKYVMHPRHWRLDWSKPEQIRQLRIADLACGTGTLLMATADAVTDNYISACVAAQVKPDLKEIHDALISDVIHGHDVLQSAIHLTASTLALRMPEQLINETNLSCLALGGVGQQLGSLEFFETNRIYGNLFSQPERIGGQDSGPHAVTLPTLDLCVMNPPFTSSRRANLLFGTMADTDRKAMQERLKKLVAQRAIPANITAGLGAVFVALADQYLKPGGRLAFVLPRSILGGIAWEPTRTLIRNRYALEMIAVCHEPGHWNFSENTDLSEALFVAKRNVRTRASGSEVVRCVNLWRHPRNAIEGMTLGRLAAEGGAPPDIVRGHGTRDLRIGATKYGEVSSATLALSRRLPWSFLCSFAQTELTRTFLRLLHGKYKSPGIKRAVTIPMCALDEIAELGPDTRDVYDGFRPTDSPTEYRALWGHIAGDFTQIAQNFNSYLNPLDSPRPTRKIRDAAALWDKAARLLIAMRTRLNTKSVTAVLLGKPALADVWWPVKIRRDIAPADSLEKALALWLNSTLGILMLVGIREETQGPFVQYKKPTLRQMRVPDFRRITSRQLAMLTAAYEKLGSAKLRPIPQVDGDPVRAEVDQAIAKAFGLPDVEEVRCGLAREPLLALTLDRLRG